MSFDDAFELRREVLEDFADVQYLASDLRGRTTDPRTGELVRELGDTWTGRALAYRCECHREMAELRKTRPVYVIELDPRYAALPKRSGPARPWSRAEDVEAFALWQKKTPNRQIASRLDRSVSAVRAHLLALRAEYRMGTFSP